MTFRSILTSLVSAFFIAGLITFGGVANTSLAQDQLAATEHVRAFLGKWEGPATATGEVQASYRNSPKSVTVKGTSAVIIKAAPGKGTNNVHGSFTHRWPRGENTYQGYGLVSKSGTVDFGGGWEFTLSVDGETLLLRGLVIDGWTHTFTYRKEG